MRKILNLSASVDELSTLFSIEHPLHPSTFILLGYNKPKAHFKTSVMCTHDREAGEEDNRELKQQFNSRKNCQHLKNCSRWNKHDKV